MNLIPDKTVLGGKWLQVRGKIRQEWGRWTGQDLERIRGRFEQWIGRAQEGYGFTRARAGLKVHQILEQVNQKKSSRVKFK